MKRPDHLSIAQAFLVAARREHRGAGSAIERIQAILRLSDDGSYIDDERVFGFSGRYISPRSINVLQVIHAMASILAIVMLLLFS